MTWNPEKYARFSDLRLRPALDLMARIPPLPEGDVMDLGCGAGAVAPALAARFAAEGRLLAGLDSSAEMLAKASALEVYDRLDQGDIALWQAPQRYALIYSNAALHWVTDHAELLPRLAGQLAPGGVLAVHVPHQNGAPSHQGWLRQALALLPGWQAPKDIPGILTPQEYFDILSPLGRVDIWETEYFQHLLPVAQGHPVRHFTESTFARPILNPLSKKDQARLIAAYEAQMAQDYPVRPDGSALFPFRRLFFTLTIPGAET